MTEKVGPLVSVHCIGCSLPNPYGFTNMTRPRITLFAENLGILPIDDVIVLHCMVSNCWLRLFALWLFSSLPSKFLFTGLQLLSVFLMFIESSAKPASSLSYICLITISVRYLVHTVCGSERVSLILSFGCTNIFLKVVWGRTAVEIPCLRKIRVAFSVKLST